VQYGPGARKDWSRGRQVDTIRTANICLIVVYELDVVLLGYVVIESRSTEPSVIAAFALEIQIVAVVVRICRNPALQARCIVRQLCDLCERCPDQRIRCRRKSSRCGNLVKIHAVDSARRILVAEHTAERFGRQYSAGRFYIRLRE